MVASQSFDPSLDATFVAVIDPAMKNNCLRLGMRDHKTGQIYTLLQVKEDLTKDVTGDTGYYFGASRMLDKYAHRLIWTHYIIIESQMKMNYDMTRLCQHQISYLMALTRNQGFRPIIIELDAKIKSKIHQAPKMTKPQLKKWAVEKAIAILLARGDKETARLISIAKKGDDHGDTVCYEDAWWMILDQGLYPVPRVQAPRPQAVLSIE